MSVNNSLGNDGFPTPVGTILPFFGKQANRLPSAWLYCAGQELVKTDYPELYATIGDDFNLTTTTTGSFCLPQLALGDNYLYPSDETEAGGDGGVSPAKIQFDTKPLVRKGKKAVKEAIVYNDGTISTKSIIGTLGRKVVF